MLNIQKQENIRVVEVFDIALDGTFICANGNVTAHNTDG